MLLTIDFETYYDTKSGYTLGERLKNHVSMAEYIASPKFKAFGAAVWMRGKGYESSKAEWLSPVYLSSFLAGLDWRNTAIMAHNVKFDGAILRYAYGHVPRLYIDTLSMARAVLGTRAKGFSLKDLAEHFSLIPKGLLNTDGLSELTEAQERELALYCEHDTSLCFHIYKELEPLLPSSQFQQIDENVRRFIFPRLMLDKYTLIQCNIQEHDRRESIFKTIGIEKKVFASNDRFPALLRQRGFQVPMKRSPSAARRGENKLIPALSVSDEEFMDMRNSDNKELQDLCEARVAAKSTLLETRSERLLKVADLSGFPFDMNFSGARQTHRSSGGSGAGGNPQNFTRNSLLRKAVRVPEGHKLLVADYAAIEARIQAFIAKETRLMAVFHADGDPYTDFASRYFGRPVTKADEYERRFGKTCILGLGYSMGPDKFRYRARIETERVISDQEANDAVKFYRSQYCMIPSQWRNLDYMLRDMSCPSCDEPVPNAQFLRAVHEAIVLPSGLRLRYPNLRQEENEWVYDAYRNGRLERSKIYGGKLFENICQALAGEVKKEAIRRLVDAGVGYAGEVHDELLVVSSMQAAESDAAILHKAMTDPMPWWKELKLKAEVGIGDNWMEAKK